MDDEADDGAGELRHLLDDLQVREFLLRYLSIPDAEGRAHLRRVLASVSVGESAGAVERQRRLKLAPRARLFPRARQ